MAKLYVSSWFLLFIVTVCNYSIKPAFCINWVEIRKQREQENMFLSPSAEGINNVNNDNYRFQKLLPDVKLYYTEKGKKIEIEDTINVASKLSIENALDDELGPQSLAEIVAIVKHMIAGQKVINASVEISEVDIRDFLNSEVCLYVEDAVEIFKEILFYYAPENLDPDELKQMATPIDNSVITDQGELLSTVAPVAPNQTYTGHSRAKRKIINSSWGNCVYYTISDDFSSTEESTILSAIAHWESETCLTFTRRHTSWLNNGINFVPLETTTSCGRSPVGKKSSGNRIQLACVTVGTTVHEIGHSLGFWHEQQRPDRDDYVIVAGSLLGDVNYQRKTWGSIFAHGIPYDYSSIMHYGDEIGKMTLKDETMTYTVGQTTGLSFRDSKLANFHLCKDSCSSPLEWSSCQHSGYRDPNSCTICRCPTGWRGTRCQTRDNDGVCGSSSRTATASKQTLASPSVTGEVDCAWLITAPSYYTVNVKFTNDFKMRGTGSREACERDYVEIRRKNINQIGARRCGYNSRPSETYESATNQMMLVFHSDNLLSYYEFSFQYWTGTCGACTSHYSPEKACNSYQTQTCSVSYTVSCGSWFRRRRCTRRRYHKCTKLLPFCCHGTLDGGQCDVGCGGCTNTFIKNQPSCEVRHTKVQSYSTRTSCGWFRRCRRTRYRSVYSHTTKECCGGYRLSSDKTRCIKP